MRIYLAAPYSHPNPAVCLFRIKAVNRMAAKLLKEGHEVFSPLSMGHAICSTCELPTDFSFWRATCLSMIEHWATHVYVLDLEGWKESVGVHEEMALAEKLGLVCEVKEVRKSDHAKYKIRHRHEFIKSEEHKIENHEANGIIKSYIDMIHDCVHKMDCTDFFATIFTVGLIISLICAILFNKLIFLIYFILWFAIALLYFLISGLFIIVLYIKYKFTSMKNIK